MNDNHVTDEMSMLAADVLMNGGGERRMREEKQAQSTSGGRFPSADSILEEKSTAPLYF